MLRHFKYIPIYFLFFILACLVLPGRSAEIELLDPTPTFTYKVIASYPHDPDASTQGLVIDNGILYEGTGKYEKSSLRRVDLQSGEVLQLHKLPSRFFGEGVTVFGNRIIQLTWKSQLGFVYEKDSFKQQRVFKYPGEGWGITHDGKNLIMSDGTDTIRFLNPETFEEERRINVADERGPVAWLNELEYVKGTIFANVWKTDRIALIDAKTGKVTGWLDLTGILPKKSQSRRDIGVLNGIAYDADNEALYITGKHWPMLFQIEPSLNRGKTMPIQQQIFALLVSVLVFVIVVDMVRKRRLREEYSVLWLATSVVMFVLVLRYKWLVALTAFIGAGLATTTLFIFALIFLMLLSVQFCIKISQLTDQVKNLSQENALMKREIESLVLSGSSIYNKDQATNRGAASGEEQ